jgi:hypothetical protein
MPAIVMRFAAWFKPAVHAPSNLGYSGRRRERGKGEPMRYDPGDHIGMLLIAVLAFLLCLSLA